MRGKIFSKAHVTAMVSRGIATIGLITLTNMETIHFKGTKARLLSKIKYTFYWYRNLGIRISLVA